MLGDDGLVEGVAGGDVAFGKGSASVGKGGELGEVGVVEGVVVAEEEVGAG